MAGFKIGTALTGKSINVGNAIPYSMRFDTMDSFSGSPEEVMQFFADQISSLRVAVEQLSDRETAARCIIQVLDSRLRKYEVYPAGELPDLVKLISASHHKAAETCADPSDARRLRNIGDYMLEYLAPPKVGAAPHLSVIQGGLKDAD